MTPIMFTVHGKPEPQGSARAFTYHRKAEKGGGIGARVDSDNPKLKGWRKAVAVEASRAMFGQPLVVSEGVRVRAVFYLPRPKSLRADKPHVTRPDVDKEARAILDAMTGVVYADDGQVVQLSVGKVYASAGAEPRAVIRVEPLSAAESGRLL